MTAPYRGMCVKSTNNNLPKLVFEVLMRFSPDFSFGAGGSPKGCRKRFLGLGLRKSASKTGRQRTSPALAAPGQSPQWGGQGRLFAGLTSETDRYIGILYRLPI